MTIKEFIDTIIDDATFTIYKQGTKKTTLLAYCPNKQKLLESYSTRKLLSYGQKFPNKEYQLYIK